MNEQHTTVRDIYFTSWRYVRVGGFNLSEMSSAGSSLAWMCDRGRAYDDRGTATAADRGTGQIIQEGQVAAENLESNMRYVTCAPHGIRLQAQMPTRVQFTDRLGMPNDGWPGPLTIIFDEGKYRCWHSLLPDVPLDKLKLGFTYHGFDHHLSYAESTDGFNWTRPKLGVVEYEGRRDHNILMTPYVLDGRPRGMFGPSVFIDPHGVAAERFKMVYLARFTEEEAVAFVRKHPANDDVMAWAEGYWGHKKGYAIGLAGAVSPDGIHWTPLEEPLQIHHSDNTPNASFDVQRGKYVCYMRMWSKADDSPESPGIIGRRSVGLTTSDDFRNWSKPEILLNNGGDRLPSTVYYQPGHTWLPGCDRQQVMFVNCWRQFDDTMDLSLFATMDGCSWSQVPGGESILPPGEIGTWDGSTLYGGSTMIELPGGKWALPYMGMPIPHKYPRMNPAKRSLHHGVEAHRGYAVWPKGRLVALECPDEGGFSTVAVRPAGARLFLNAQVEPAGYIKVGLRQLTEFPDRMAAAAEIPQRTLDDCDVIWGKDSLEIPVTWKGQDTLKSNGAPVIVTFQLRRAKLFDLHFR